MLTGVEVEHEGGEGSLEAGALGEVDREAGTGDLGGSVEVEDAEGFTDLPVRLGGEGEGGRAAPGVDDYVVVLGVAGGDGVGGEVGKGLEEVAQTVVRCGGNVLEGFCFGFELAGLLGQGGGVSSGFAEGLDFGGEAVTLSA